LLFSVLIGQYERMADDAAATESLLAELQNASTEEIIQRARLLESEVKVGC